MTKKNRKKNLGGFTLIEVLITSFVLVMVGVAIATALAAAVKSVTYAKTKIAAVALANEKMEIIHNMPYDDLATLHGPIYPPGNILDDETVTKENIGFKVHTSIAYVDDPYDGNAEGTIQGKPVDIYPYDYKKVSIEVGAANKSTYIAKISTNIAGKAAETASNTGILKICVIDAAHQPLSEVILTIINTAVSPAVNIQTTTDIAGCAMIPKLPPDSHNNYHVEVTKTGYSTDSTYPRTAQNPNALHPDLDILLQQVTNQTFSIDRLSSMQIQFVDQTGANIPSVTFSLQGTKLIYFNPDTPKYLQTFTTDATGKITIPNLEFDDYEIINVSSYYVTATVPPRPIHLNPNTSLSVTATLSTSASNPTISNIIPIQGQVGETVTIAAVGSNLAPHSTAELISGTGVIITGTNIETQGQDTLYADFNLNGAATGLWSFKITNPAGEWATLTNSFEVKN